LDTRIRTCQIIFLFCFHHLFNLVRGSVLASSGSNSFWSQLREIELQFFYPTISNLLNTPFSDRKKYMIFFMCYSRSERNDDFVGSILKIWVTSSFQIRVLLFAPPKSHIHPLGFHFYPSLFRKWMCKIEKTKNHSSHHKMRIEFEFAF
jgi:hypothetical protein